MTSLKFSAMCGLAMIVLSGHSIAEDITRQRAEELLQECQSERARNIAPLREQAIDECINKKQKDRDYCERYYRNYGETTASGTRRGMYWNLPCLLYTSPSPRD